VEEIGMRKSSLRQPFSWLQSLLGQLSKPQRRQAAIYLAGLIWLISFRSIREIAREYGQGQVDRLHHLLSNSPVDTPSLQRSGQGNLARLAAGQSPSLILDDTPEARDGKAIEGIGFHHGAKGLVRGQCAVTALLKSGPRCLFWGVRAYRPRKTCAKVRDFRSKIELAWDLLTEAEGHFGPGHLTVVFDCWYSAARILNRIQANGWLYVVALRANRVVYLQGRKKHLRDLAKGRRGCQTFKLSAGRRVRCVAVDVKLPRVGEVRVVLWRIGRDPWRFLVCNDRHLSAVQIVRRYLQRPWIDELHRDLKQFLGFGELFVRRWEAVQKHWTLVALAYNLVALSAVQHRHRRSFRQALRAYRESIRPEELIHCFL
jgi:DDE superfamily endonuclease